MANKQQAALLRTGVDLWNNWRRANYEVKPDLSGMDLKGADLRGYKLEGANFSNSNLVNADLSLSRLTGATFSNCVLNGTSFQGSHLMDANINNSYAPGADFRNAFMIGMVLKNTALYGVKYNRWGVFKHIRIHNCYGSQEFVRFAKDQSYIEEFRGTWAARPLILATIKWHSLKQLYQHVKSFVSLTKQKPTNYRKWFKYMLWSITCDCGRSFSLWFCWSMLMTVFFGCVYAGFIVPDSITPVIEVAGRAETGFTPFYFSIVTFTTLGFGDVLPKNLAGEVWLTVEVLLGYAMLGGLISIFSTKVTRRAG